MNLPASRNTAVEAAIEVGEAAGFRDARPVVLQDTNNVVVWLAPHEVVAKVGMWAHSSEVLGRELDVCSYLASSGAPVAAPIGQLRRSAATDWPVSLWERVPSTDIEASDQDLARMLELVHAALKGCPVELPSYLVAVDHARATLFDDDRMAALSPSDLDVLRLAFEEWSEGARHRRAPLQAVHGEPHLDNVILGTAGPTLIDFEAASIGPLEWDLASMAPGVAEAYGRVDPDLLALLRLLNSARVATWCWAFADHPRMRAHGEHHLEVVRTTAR